MIDATTQRAALAIRLGTRPDVSPELAALTELLALVDVLIETGHIHVHLPDPGANQACDAFCEALDRGNELVAKHFRARAGV
jgi:hypothetical protein